LKEKEAIVLRVKGDSMIGSRIYEGDKVVVKMQQEVENGEIAVVNVNGDEATLKRVKRTENGQVILYPDNPKYEPIIVTNESARVIGKVIQVMFEPK
jgi:repressor LexA